jgi:hypothetical protein
MTSQEPEIADQKPGIGSSAKKVLVISFSQSGQLDRIVASFLAPLRTSVSAHITEEVLTPVKPFPFPWKTYQFLDVFPESFHGIPTALKPLRSDGDDRYDLVILAYQVWYLAPSIPISSFLQSSEARRLLRDTPVITIVGCRNMWIRAHEKVKEYLRAADARLVGHIVLADRAYQFVSIVTVIYWMRTGRQDRMLGLFPKPGVSEQDIAHCSEFGHVVANSLSYPIFPNIQDRLNELSACRVVPHLMFLENRGARVFDVWSRWIMARGAPGDPRRGRLARFFGSYVICLIALFSPLSFLLFHATLPFRRTAVRRQIQEILRY